MELLGDGSRKSSDELWSATAWGNMNERRSRSALNSEGCLGGLGVESNGPGFGDGLGGKGHMDERSMHDSLPPVTIQVPSSTLLKTQRGKHYLSCRYMDVISRIWLENISKATGSSQETRAWLLQQYRSFQPHGAG